MPKLPDKYDLGAPPGVAARPPMVTEPLPVGGDMATLGEVGKGVTGLGLMFQERQDKADEYATQKALIEFDLQQEKLLDEAKRNAPPEAKDFTASYRGSYDRAATGFMQSVPPALRPKVDEALVKRGANFEKRAHDFELAERDRWNVQDVQKNAADLITHTMGSPDSMEDNAQRGIALIRASRLSARAKVEAERKFLDSNAEYGIKAQIDRAIETGDDVDTIVKRLRKVPRGSLGLQDRVYRADEALPGEQIGSVSAKYESGGRGVGMVSSGRQDPGGVSYGIHQLSTKDSMPAFLRSDEAAPFADKFKGLRPGSPEFNRVYKEVAASDPKGFAGAQYDFYSRTHYQPVLEHARERGLNVDDRGVQEALFSIAVQHGGARNIVDKAMDMTKGGGGAADQVKALYSARYDYVDGLRTLPKATKASVLDRYDNEVRDVLALVGSTGGKPVGGAVTQGSETKTADVGGAPVEVVADEKKAPKVEVDEDGRPRLSNDIGETRADIPEAPKPGTPVASPDELEESDEPGYSYMSPATRRKLINYARVAGRTRATQDVDDDIERIRVGRQPKTGPDGRTSLDRAKSTLTNMQYAKKKQAWDEARLEHEELSGLRSMTNEEAADHVATMLDRAEGNEESIKAISRIQKKADAQLKKMMEVRDKDPAFAVMGYRGESPDERTPPMPEIQEARRLIESSNGAPKFMTGPDGTLVPVPGSAANSPRLTPQQKYEVLFEARLKAQDRIMPDEPDRHRILTKAEAQKLLRIPTDNPTIDYRAYRKRLEQAAAEAEQKFGPKYASRAIEEAIGFHLAGRSSEQKQAQAKLLKDMARGREVSSADVRALRDIEAIDSASISGGIDAMSRIDRAGRASMPQAPVPIANAGRPAIGQGMPQPTPKQVEWLQANPDGWQEFDLRFGRGAAARTLGAPSGDAWGGKRGTLPKSKNADDFKNMSPSTGWFGFGR